MFNLSYRARYVLRNPLPFAWQVLSAFRRNQGVLLAAAVAYHSLLSIIPIIALTAIGLSQWLDPILVLDAAKEFLDLVSPTQTGKILTHIEAFIYRWKVIGVVGIVSLIFFSALAFSSLESALSRIFEGFDTGNQRKAWISLLLPYVFVLFIGLAILSLTLITALFDALSVIGNARWLPDSRLLMTFIGFFGEVGIFTAIYFVLPRVKVRLKHAIVGGVVAALLWEAVRRILVWYVINLSSANVIFGTISAVMVMVLSLEVATIILLLGAQVIREYSALERDL
ncbi:MAG: YihY/virulence factor BrkB family protein [Acidiferrobacterales bacterium]